MSKNKEIIVYTNKTCGFCNDTLKALDKANVEYVEKPLNENREEWGVVQLITGVPLFPTIKVGDRYWCPQRDWQRPEQLVQILGYVDKLEDTDDSVKLIEAFKTLTYSFNNGFNTLFQKIDELKNKIDEHKSTN
jgi:glutaredoxin